MFVHIVELLAWSFTLCLMPTSTLLGCFSAKPKQDLGLGPFMGGSFNVVWALRHKYWGDNWSFIGKYCSSSKISISVKNYRCLCSARQELDRAWAQHFSMHKTSSWVAMTAFSTMGRSIIEQYFNVSWGHRVAQPMTRKRDTILCHGKMTPSINGQPLCTLLLNRDVILQTIYVSRSLPLAGNDFILQTSVLVLWYRFRLIVKLIIYRSLLSECKQILVLKALLMHNVWILISSPS